MGATLVRRLAMGHRMNDRQAVRDLRGFGQVLAKPQPGHLGLDAPERTAILLRCIRLRIKRLLVRDAAGKEDVNDGLGHPLLRFEKLLLRLEPEKVAERQPQSADQADLQETAARMTSHKIMVLPGEMRVAEVHGGRMEGRCWHTP
jgi:hypothetical protein